MEWFNIKCVKGDNYYKGLSGLHQHIHSDDTIYCYTMHFNNHQPFIKVYWKNKHIRDSIFKIYLNS